MGIAGLVLGILGLIGSFIPFVVFGSWLFALVGIIISAIAVKQGHGGIAVAGLVLSIVGFVIAIPSLICAAACAGAASKLGAW